MNRCWSVLAHLFVCLERPEVDTGMFFSITLSPYFLKLVL